MIEITGYENIGKGKYRTTFDNGTTCVLYRTEAVRYSIMEGAFISEADYEKLIIEVVGKRAKKRALHLLEQMDRSGQLKPQAAGAEAYDKGHRQR